MGRAQWGGGQDYSSVFGSLQNQFEGTLANAVQTAANKADADRNALATATQSKWKNGLISDTEWLAFLQQMVTETVGDPANNAQWVSTLNDNKGAIDDSQFEANYSMGKISLAQLLTHYKTQMGQVETNSPKWRDYASRYAQIQNSIRSGSGGSGGGSGSGNQSRAIKNALAAGTAGPQSTDGLSYDPNGPDVINPANAFMGYSDGGDFLDNLFSDLRRIDDLMAQVKGDSSLTSMNDRYTDHSIPVNPEMLGELDRQYLRTEDQIVAYNEGLGTPAGLAAAVKATSAKNVYIAGPMMQHNKDAFQPVYDALVQNTAKSVAQIGNMPDPYARLQAYKELGRTWSQLEDGTLEGLGGRGLQGAYTGDFKVAGGAAKSEAHDTGQPVTTTRQMVSALPPELQVTGQMFQDAETYKSFFAAMSDANMDPDAKNLMIQHFLDSVTGKEGQMSKADAQIMVEGDDGSTSGKPVTGILETHDQYNGLAHAADPAYVGPRYVYISDDNGLHLVEAEAHDTAHDGGHVTSELAPKDVDTSSLVRVVTKIGGAVQAIWMEPKPVNDPRFLAYQIKGNYDANFQPTTVAKAVFKDGSYLSSNWIAANGGERVLSQMTRADKLVRTSQVQAVDLPDGSRFYVDPETRLLSHQPPALFTQDKTTGGVEVDGTGTVQTHYGTSAGSSFVGYYGMTRQEVQAFVSKSARDGTIVPTDWGYRNPGGDVLNGPGPDGTWDDMTVDSMLWSKADAALSTRHSDAASQSAFNSQVETRKRSLANNDFVRAGIENLGQGRADNALSNQHDPFAQVKDFGKMFGLDLGDPTETQAPAAHGRMATDIGLPGNDGVFAIHQRQAEVAARKSGMISLAPAQATRADLPVAPPPSFPALAAARTYAQLREGSITGTTPPINPLKVAKPPVVIPTGRYAGKKLSE